MKFLEDMNIKIKNKALLETALTHSSYANEHGIESYERLEFLGDAMLQIASSEFIYKNMYLTEGEMSKLRANFVCEKALATYSKDLGIDKHIRVSHGVAHLTDAIIADVFESVSAVIFLECGFEVARDFLFRIMSPYIKENRDFNTDYKSKLQEAVQTTRKSLKYVLINEYGEAHDKTFEIAVIIDDITYGKGIGKTKKEAEQNAAYDALEKSVII